MHMMYAQADLPSMVVVEYQGEWFSGTQHSW